ncbi:MAG: ACP phosphodiesterase [Flavobacteriales bacterium]|nr:MAG: ACP phosphodiesterase [Flavobacteriales bacterium]
MNYLAHFYLSGNNVEIIIGNYIGDAVKGGNFSNYSNGVRQGIVLHRKIDAFTDSHEIVKESKAHLRKKYRHYAGVIVDVFYDHFLAKNWDGYSDELLDDFSKKMYLLLEKRKATFPYKSQLFLQYMVANNILVNYAKLQGIQQVFNGLAHRTKFDSKMENAVHDLKKDYEIYEKEFQAFFPELKNYASDLLA